eukprot:scaffold28911_cov62-Phaeocystis_antarctica.AAC.6
MLITRITLITPGAVLSADEVRGHRDRGASSSRGAYACAAAAPRPFGFLLRSSWPAAAAARDATPRALPAAVAAAAAVRAALLRLFFSPVSESLPVRLARGSKPMAVQHST